MRHANIPRRLLTISRDLRHRISTLKIFELPLKYWNRTICKTGKWVCFYCNSSVISHLWTLIINSEFTSQNDLFILRLNNTHLDPLLGPRLDAS